MFHVVIVTNNGNLADGEVRGHQKILGVFNTCLYNIFINRVSEKSLVKVLKV